MTNRTPSEQDIITKKILPAVTAPGKWDLQTQIEQEVSFTKGRITVRGKTVRRGKTKRADIILYLKPNRPLAIIEAKDGGHSADLACNKGWSMERFSTSHSSTAPMAMDSWSMTVRKPVEQ
jgi:type I restriction enzyme R subunit